MLKTSRLLLLQSRAFASPLKLSATKFLATELKANPEFYKAFPHLAPETHKGETQRFNDPYRESPFFESLTHQHNDYLKPLNEKEMLLRDNELNFVQANQAHVEGPRKYLTEDEKTKVHQEIFERMQKLEDTGLTRVELLFQDKEGKGVQLKDDPFFQLVKNSKVVREMMVPANGEFSADRVIEMALRQDFGPDPSMSALRLKLKAADDSPFQPLWEYKKKYRDKDPLMSSEHHFAAHQFREKQEKLASYELEKPATFINRPLSRSQLRKKFMRSVTKDEIEYKNGAFMVKFLNPSGKLYNRYQSRLPTVIQRRVAKTIKKMRHLGLLPFVGVLAPTDKIPLGNYIDEVEEVHKKTIDPVTGRIFMRHQLQDDLRDRARRQVKKLDERTKAFGDYDVEETEEQMKVRLDIIREMSLDSMHLLPNAAQREWLSAQAYVLEENGVLEEMKEKAIKEGRPYVAPRFDIAGVEQAFETVVNRIIDTSADPLGKGETLMLDLLHEKAHELSRFAVKVETPVEKLLGSNKDEPTQADEQQVRRSIERLLKKYGQNKADQYHENESVKNGRRVVRPKLKEPEVI